jgi:hypothetical protein
MFKILLASSFLVFLFSKCERHFERKPGGACTYDTIPFKAVVIQINTISGSSKDSFYSIKLKLNSPVMKDTMLLSELTRETQNNEFLIKHEIKIGKMLAGKAFFIQSGSCSPKYYKMDDMSF